MEDYELLRHLCTSGCGGGGVLFSLKELRPTRLSTEIHKDIEFLWVRTVLGIHHYKSNFIVFFFVCLCCIQGPGEKPWALVLLGPP